LSPASQQEAYDMVHYGFDFSEKYQDPGVAQDYYPPGALPRCRGSRAAESRESKMKFVCPSDLKQFILLPAIARRRYKGLLASQALFEEESEKSGYNKYF
jgi:indolepyruvate ferredoxin oxidoreductase, alpha subunit